MSLFDEPKPAASLSRRLWSFTWTGPLMGALFYAGLFGWCLLRHQGAEYMGMSDSGITDFIISLFQEEIIALQLRLLGIYLMVGACAGVFANMHWIVVAAVQGKRPRRGRDRAWRVFLTVAGYHLWFLIRALITHPQVMYEHFYGAGGFWTRFQVFVSEYMPPDLLDTLAFAYVTVITGAALIVLQRRLATKIKRAVSRSKGMYGAMAGAALVCGVAAAMALKPVRPPVTNNNILIIAVDSLRADRILNDGFRDLPNLDAFANEATTFTSAWTVMPRTFPSWVSILTARYPHEHGVRHMFPGPKVLAVDRETLMTRLSDAGYRTGVVSDFAGDIFSRIELGFETVRVPRFTLQSNVQLGGYKLHYHLMPYLLTALGGSHSFPILKLYERTADPESLTDEARRWIRQGDGRPFALVVFYSAPHFPYSVPHPSYGRYTSETYDGPSRFHKASWSNAAKAPGENERTQVKALYDGALYATDRAIGRLLDDLVALDLLNNTHIVVTADHGENLYEQGFGIGHGDHLRGSNSLRIPFMLRPAGTKHPHRAIQNPVRSIDIAPTLLDYAGLAPLEGATGKSLKRLVNGQTRPEDPPVFFETGLWFLNPEAAVLEGKTMTFAEGFGAFSHDEDTHEIYFDETFDDDFLVAKHRAVMHDGYKLIYIPTRHGVFWELYDVRNDPDERQNLVHERPELANRMRALLRTWMLSDPGMVEMGEYVVPRIKE